jgi:hypothetical protein
MNPKQQNDRLKCTDYVSLRKCCVKRSHSPKIINFLRIISTLYLFMVYLVTSAGMLSRYSNSLRAGRSVDRFLVRRDFSHPSRHAGVHPACCTMGTGFYPRVKRPECGADHPSPSNAGLRMCYGCTSAPPLCLHRHAMGVTFTFFLTTISNDRAIGPYNLKLVINI